MKMKLSTFCILLASALMLMSALIVGIIKDDREIPEKVMAASIGEVTDADEYLLAVNGRVGRRFGAEYDEFLGQWSQNEDLAVTVNQSNRQIEACGDLRVRKIDSTEKGVCMMLTMGNAEISIWPVTSVHVFAGSKLKEGDVVAEAGEYLSVSVWTDGRAEDPERFLKLTGG